MALPPFDAGAVHEIVADASPAVAVTAVGAPGTVAGVTLLEASEAGPVPTAFVAVTVNVYAVPFVSPVTVAVVGTSVLPTGGLTVAEPPAGEEVTVYEVIALPPFEAGAVQDTLAAALPAVATTPVGAPGAVAAPTGVTAFDGVDAGPVPAALEALTVKKYVVPFVNPVTVALVAGAATVAVSPPGLDVTVYEVTMLPPSTS